MAGCRAGRAGFHVPCCGPFLVAEMVWAGQMGAMGWMRVIAAVISRAQGQRSERRSRSRRQPRTSRLAAVKYAAVWVPVGGLCR